MAPSQTDDIHLHVHKEFMEPTKSSIMPSSYEHTNERYAHTTEASSVYNEQNALQNAKLFTPRNVHASTEAWVASSEPSHDPQLNESNIPIDVQQYQETSHKLMHEHVVSENYREQPYEHAQTSVVDEKHQFLVNGANIGQIQHDANTYSQPGSEQSHPYTRSSSKEAWNDMTPQQQTSSVSAYDQMASIANQQRHSQDLSTQREPLQYEQQYFQKSQSVYSEETHQGSASGRQEFHHHPSQAITIDVSDEARAHNVHQSNLLQTTQTEAVLESVTSNGSMNLVESQKKESVVVGDERPRTPTKSEQLQAGGEEQTASGQKGEAFHVTFGDEALPETPVSHSSSFCKEASKTIPSSHFQRPS